MTVQGAVSFAYLSGTTLTIGLFLSEDGYVSTSVTVASAVLKKYDGTTVDTIVGPTAAAADGLVTLDFNVGTALTRHQPVYVRFTADFGYGNSGEMVVTALYL